MRETRTAGWRSDVWPRMGVARIATWYERWRQRRALEELDERLLRDIGLSRRQATRESDKPFWMV